MRREMVIDLERYICCRSSAVVCKQHNGQTEGNWWNRVFTPLIHLFSAVSFKS